MQTYIEDRYRIPEKIRFIMLTLAAIKVGFDVGNLIMQGNHF